MSDSDRSGVSRRPLVVRLAGDSGSGKTRFGTRLVRELTARGVRVAAVKHAARHTAPPDRPGKDTQRYRESGALAVAGIFRDETVIRLSPGALSLEAMLDVLAIAADLIIVEGYHELPLPTISVAGASGESRGATGETIARVGEGLGNGRPTTDGVPCFSPDDVSDVADLLERLLPRAPASDEESSPG